MRHNEKNENIARPTFALLTKANEDKIESFMKNNSKIGKKSAILQAHRGCSPRRRRCSRQLEPSFSFFLAPANQPGAGSQCPGISEFVFEARMRSLMKTDKKNGVYQPLSRGLLLVCYM
jgi:hypothetical protein